MSFPWPWKKVTLALIPGGLAVAGLLNEEFSSWTMAGAVVLMLLLWLALFLNQRQLPAWSLMALGCMAALALTMMSGLLGGLAALLVGGSGPTVVWLLYWAAICALNKNLGGKRIPALAWITLAAIVVCQLAVRFKYFALYGISWPIVAGWLNVSLFSAGNLLLPLAIGTWLARRHGQAALLFLVGATYMGFQNLADNGGHVSAQIGNTPLFALYLFLPPLFFTILAPLWFLRAGSARLRLLGLLALIGAALVFDILISGLVRGDFSQLIWLSSIPYVLSLLLSFGLAFFLYERVANAGEDPVDAYI